MSSAARRRNPSNSRRSGPRQPAPKRVSVIPWVIGGVIAVALVTLVLLTVGRTSEAAPEVGTPSISGAPLPYYQDSAPDPTIDGPIPEVTGADFAGNPVTIGNDGRAKAIIFVAHWCPVCQREVPAVTDWLAGNSVPEGVDIYTVATGIEPDGQNYPTSAWLEREEWPFPVLVDDAISSVAGSFGLSAYPFWVFVSGEGNVIGRHAGLLEPETLDTVLNTLPEV